MPRLIDRWVDRQFDEKIVNEGVFISSFQSCTSFSFFHIGRECYSFDYI